MASEHIFSDATTLAGLVRSKQVSPVEIMQAHLDRIAAVNPEINAIVTVADGALAAAKAAEAAVIAGDALGPLHGVPFTVKDSIETAGVPTQRGSPIFKGRLPDTDATSVARMKQAGALLLGKTNLPEFSYWIESDNLLSGRTNNPWDVTRTPGGSSGGESAAIAAGMSPIGLGTDLAISVRGPAAQTGITSMKPTHGRVPMTGIWPRAPRRFWHVGPMARSVRDVALAFSATGRAGRARRVRQQHRRLRRWPRPRARPGAPRRLDGRTRFRPGGSRGRRDREGGRRRAGRDRRLGRTRRHPGARA